MNALYIFAFVFAALGALHFIVSARVRGRRIMRRLYKADQIGSDLAPAPGGLQLCQEWGQTLAAPLAGMKERASLREKLSSAAYRKQWHVDAFLLGKFFFVLGASVLGWYWLELQTSALLQKPLDSLKFLFLVFLAARAPDWWLTGQIARRQSRIRAAVPQAVDLMTICVEAGTSLEEAFGRVALEMRAKAHEIASEFKLTRSEMLVMDRSEALRRLERRSKIREMESLASSLLQSIHYGTPIAEALRLIASDSRARQVSELEEKAGTIAARVGIPLILLILFPLVVLIAAPALINLARAL